MDYRLQWLCLITLKIFNKIWMFRIKFIFLRKILF